MCNADRVFPMTKQEKEEILRSERFNRIFDTLKHVEAELPLLVPTQNDRAAPARSGQNFYKAGKTDTKDPTALQQYAYTNLQTSNPVHNVKTINK